MGGFREVSGFKDSLGLWPTQPVDVMLGANWVTRPSYWVHDSIPGSLVRARPMGNFGKA
jgi:hypothetical protein